MSVRIQNRQGTALKDRARVVVAGETTQHELNIAPGATQDVLAGISEGAWMRLLPGSVGVEVSLAGLTQRSKVVVWPVDGNAAAPPAPPAQMLVLAHGGSKEKPLPTRARFDIGRKVQRVYVLTVFQYYTIKCYAPQAEWVLTYDDGTTEAVSWVPPYDVNGHQRPESPWSLPVTAVGQFAEDHSKTGDHAYGPFHAQLVDIEVNPAKILKSMEARQTQTESFMAILGVTLGLTCAWYADLLLTLTT